MTLDNKKSQPKKKSSAREKTVSKKRATSQKKTTPKKTRSPKKSSPKRKKEDLLTLTSDFKEEMKKMEDLVQDENSKEPSTEFSQESSFSSVTNNGHTKTVNSLKASISLPDPEKTKQMCDKISDKDPGINCVYNEKENTCYIDGTNIVNKTFEALKHKFGFNHGKESDKLKSILRENILPHQTSLIPTRSANPFNNSLSAPRIIFIGRPKGNPLSSPMSPPDMGSFSGSPLMGGGGCSLGKTNGCPDNGRLVYDAQGKIECGNMSNQGGQKFMYPKTINNFVGGKKKSLKKKKQGGPEASMHGLD